MKRFTFYFGLIILFVGCQNIKTSNKNTLNSTDSLKITQKSGYKSNHRQKNNIENKKNTNQTNVINKTPISEEIYQRLVNKKLIGLSLKDKKQKKFMKDIG